MSNNKRVRDMLDSIERLVADSGLHWRVDKSRHGGHHKIVITDGKTERTTPFSVSRKNEHSSHKMKMADVARIIRELKAAV